MYWPSPHWLQSDGQPRLRQSPEDHAWFAHFILPPGATKRLPATAPLGSPRELLLAARFRKPVPIILGILVATLANHAGASALGNWITRSVEPQWLRWALGAGQAV